LDISKEYFMDNFLKAVDLLVEARVRGRTMKSLPADCRPPRPSDAYTVQRAIVDRTLSHFGGRPVGYKIACTSQSAQEFLKFYHPFYGRLLSPFVYKTPACIDPRNFSMLVIEPEFAFEMGDDLPASGGPYDREKVGKAVRAVMPAVEIVATRYDDWTQVDVPSLIADNGCNGAWVQGPAYQDWQSIEFPAHEAILWVNGKAIRTGRGDAIMGHPFNALTWLAKILSEQGSGLRAGDLVSTGTCAEVYDAEAGDSICADFGTIGKAEVSIGKRSSNKSM
jgi:2-keto-4-pentenoate hydratase